MSNLGRPRKLLDPERIAELIGKGFTVEWVADYFQVHVDTLYANYSESLRKGYHFRNGCLQSKQLENALCGNATMQIWLGKQWLKQRDTETEKPPQVTQNILVLSEEDRKKALAIVEKLRAE